MPDHARWKYRILLTAAIGLLAFSAAAFVLAFLHWPESSSGIVYPSSPPDERLSAAMAANGEAVGWLTVSGTTIDYPVVQCGDNEYYLTHDAEKKKSRYGAIFMDCRNDAGTLGGHVVLYGHHMRDGAMFAQLLKYKKEGFFREHGVIVYSTPEDATEWEIFSAFETTADFDFTNTDFASEQDYLSYMQTLQGKSLFETDIELTAQDDVMTLSTCAYDIQDGRFVVCARKIK
jgi:sortase B